MSLAGEADFHALDVNGRRIYGYDSTSGQIMTTTDKKNWTKISREQVTDLAINHPRLCREPRRHSRRQAPETRARFAKSHRGEGRAAPAVPGLARSARAPAREPDVAYRHEALLAVPASAMAASSWSPEGTETIWSFSSR